MFFCNGANGKSKSHVGIGLKGGKVSLHVTHAFSFRTLPELASWLLCKQMMRNLLRQGYLYMYCSLLLRKGTAEKVVVIVWRH